LSGITIELDRQMFARIAENLRREQRAAASEIGALMQTSIRGEISSQNLVNTGNLRRSIQLDVRDSGRGTVAVVGTNTLYALPLEFGIHKKFFPSRAMIDSVELWVRRKIGVSSKESRSVAWAISRKIGRSGLDPKRFPARFFEKGFKSAASRVPQIIERFVRRAASRSNVS